MNTTEPQPDPSPAQREGRLSIERKYEMEGDPRRFLGDGRYVVAVTCGGNDEVNAQRLVNGWNALPIAIHAFEQLAECNLTENNCASLEVASKRIRNIANAALTAIREGKGMTL